MSQKAFYTKIQYTEKHPNADKIQIAIVDGNKTIVGLSAKACDTGILFYPDAVLNDDYAESIGVKSFLKGGRVRTVRFRGEWSECLFVPASLDEVKTLFGLDNLELHSPLPETEKVYTNYTPKVRMKGLHKGNTVRRRELADFPKHFDTQQYGSYRNRIKDYWDQGWYASISFKVHGTSARCGYVKVEQSPNPFEKIIVKLLYKLAPHKTINDGKKPGRIHKLAWKYQIKYRNYLNDKYYGTQGDYEQVLGSRTVTFKDYEDAASHYSDSSYFKDRLNKGEVIYYEILGFNRDGVPIMEPYKGKPFNYGIPDKELRILAYRITQDGIDLNPIEMAQRCDELGIMPVHYFVTMLLQEGEFLTNFEEFEKIFIEIFNHAEDNSYIYYRNHLGMVEILNYDHLNEGLVLRLDPPQDKRSFFNPRFFKLKYAAFYEAEGHLKASENISEFLDSMEGGNSNESKEEDNK